MLAGHLTYMTLLTLVPFFAITLLSASLFGEKQYLIDNFLSFLMEHIFFGIDPQYVERLSQNVHSVSFEALGVVGYFFLLILSYRLIKAIDDSFNRICKSNSRQKNADPLVGE